MKCGRGGIPVAEKSPDTREKRYDAKDVTKDIVDLGYEGCASEPTIYRPTRERSQVHGIFGSPYEYHN